LQETEEEVSLYKLITFFSLQDSEEAPEAAGRSEINNEVTDNTESEEKVNTLLTNLFIKFSPKTFISKTT
jgi:hypothetical protein